MSDERVFVRNLTNPTPTPLDFQQAAQNRERRLAIEETTAAQAQQTEAHQMVRNLTGRTAAAPLDELTPEQRATEAETRATRREIALEHGLSPEDAALLDAATSHDAARRLAARLAPVAGDRRGNHVPNEGKVQVHPGDSRHTFLHNLTGRDRG